MSLLLALHILSAVIWVGGMFYAYMAMRPAVAQTIDKPLRPALWDQALGLFFRWVWVAIVLLLVTGYAMIFLYWHGMARVPLFVHIMQGLGILMMLIFFHVYFAPYRRLHRAVQNNDTEAGGKAIGQIRMLVGINLILGLLVVVIAGGGVAGGFFPGG